MITLYISTRDTDGMSKEMAKWAKKKHPNWNIEIEIDGFNTIVMDDDGNELTEYAHIWEDFCNS